MFNIKVFRIKDILKYVVYIIICMLLIYVLNKVVIKKEVENGILEREISNIFKLINEEKAKEIIETTISAVGVWYDEGKEQWEQNQFLKAVFETQIVSANINSKVEEQLEFDEVIEEEKIEESVEEVIKNEEEIVIEEAEIDVETKVVTPNPLQESFNYTYKDVKIKNETSYKLTEAMFDEKLVVENKDVLIFNTHSCESYTSSEKYTYTQTGNFRSTETKYNVTGVASELEKQLLNYEYNVIQNDTCHDFPSYSGSYTRSLETVEKQLNETPADIVFDIHRDAIGSISDYEPSVQIGDEVAAQLMFVIGTNAGGLSHDNWNGNLKFAVEVQQKAEEMYPGLFKPIFLTESRYNQHTASYASIIEVGATGNTMDQALVSMKYLAKVLDEVLK